MALEKPSQIGVDRIIERLSVLKQRLGRIEKMQSYHRTEHWDSLKGLLSDMADMHSRKLESIVEYGRDLSDHQFAQDIRVQQAHRDDFNWVISLVEKPAEQAEKLRDDIMNLEKSLAEKRQEIKEFGLEEASNRK